MRHLLAIVAAFSLLAGCTAPTKHTGKPPLGRRRPLEGGDTPTMVEKFERRLAEAEAERRVGETDPTTERVGVAGTFIFHRPDCARLEDVSQGERILFVHAYDALDGGYGPCEDCAPLR